MRRAGERASRSAALAIGLGLIASVLLLYGRVLGHEFVQFDDYEYIVDNPFVRQGLSLEGVRWAFTSFHAANWHPLTWISHMIDSELFGARPGWPQMVNAVLHAANSVLLLLWLRSSTGRLGSSAVVAALWALHPLRVESVAWAAERKDVLAGMFWLLTLLAYTAYVRRGGRWRYLAVVVAMALGLMAKPMLVTLPFVLLLVDLWPLRRAWRMRLLLEKVPLLLLSVVSCGLTIAAQRGGEAIGSLSVTWRLLNASRAYLFYLGRTAWPDNLAFFYPHPVFVGGPEFFTWSRTIPEVVILLVLSGLALLAMRRRPWLAVGWFWYLGALLPVIGLFQVGGQAAADRYTYLPIIGIYIAVVWGVHDLASRWRVPRAAVAGLSAAAVLACMLVTRVQVGYWRDTETLSRHALEVTRNNFVAHNSLGVELAKRGDTADALEQFDLALAAYPDFAQTHYNLGMIYGARGDLDRAEQQFRVALENRENYAQAHNNLGAILLRRGDLRSAEQRFEAALAIDPGLVEAHLNLGLVLWRRGDVEGATARFLRALELDPGNVAARAALEDVERKGADVGGGDQDRRGAGKGA